MKKIRLVKNTCYDWLINYISEPIRKSVGGFKDKIVNLFKTNTPKQTAYGRGKKLSKQKKLSKHKKFFYIKREQKKIEYLQITGGFLKQKKKKKGERDQRN